MQLFLVKDELRLVNVYKYSSESVELSKSRGNTVIYTVIISADFKHNSFPCIKIINV